jgi:hypothetical protein
MQTFSYDAVIQAVPEKGSAYVAFPYDIRQLFGKGRLKVHAAFDGVPYDGSIVNMDAKNDDGSICYIISIRKGIRKAIGKEPEDTVHVEIVSA